MSARRLQVAQTGLALDASPGDAPNKSISVHTHYCIGLDCFSWLGRATYTRDTPHRNDPTSQHAIWLRV